MARMADGLVWRPQHRKDCPGGEDCTCPQVLAYASPADVIGYGGAAGGGKTDLLLGLAGTQHRRAVIFRRVFPSLRGMIERSREIFNRANANHSNDSYNEQLHVWRLSDERMIEFGAVQYDADKSKWQGQPHDMIGFDEATEFPETVVRFLLGWNRTTVPGQRCRVVLTFNPPMDDGGSWVVRFFAPWLDDQHPNPAKDGELRWYAMVDGKEIECESGQPFEHAGETITPKSRTFFHAALKDNPILEATGYGATIDAMPEPLRSLLRGNFKAGKVRDPFQLIPAEWVLAAQGRWTEKVLMRQTAIGCDVARGGDDMTVLAPLHGEWFAPMQRHPGAATPDGPTVAGLVLAARQDDSAVGVDVIGIGGSVYDSLAQAGLPVQGINFGAGAPDETDKSKKLRFINLRAACYWKFREALDPAYNGSVALPPDRELLAELCAPRWHLQGGRIAIESKEDIKARLGRSPDSADAVVLAWRAASVDALRSGHAGPNPLGDYRG